MRDWNYENDQWTKLPAHLKHLPLFTQNFDTFSIFIRYIWAFVLKFVAFRFYVRLKVIGRWSDLYKKHPKLLIISNHSSHLDATSIAASMPLYCWPDLFIAAAKDYFFSNPIFTFFSAHCLGAIPIDRKDKKGEAINLIINLLTNLPRIWLILFPEGTRSRDGKVQDFKRGVSLFAEKTQTPILFLYIEGNAELWPKGAPIPKPGKLVIHIGPVHEPAPIDQVYAAYREWAKKINPRAFEHTENPEWKQK